MPRIPKLLIVGFEGLNHWPVPEPGFEVVGIVDLYEERKAIEPGYLPESLRRVPVFTDLNEAIVRAIPDVAVVSVPGAGKTTITAEALLLQAGIEVVARKLRLNAMADVDLLKEVCTNGTQRLFVGEQYRYLPGVMSMKRLLAEERLGRIEQVTWRCNLPYEIHNWMRSYRHVALEDLAYHHFGVLHELFGLHPKRLYAHSAEPSFSRLGSRTLASVLAETEEGYRLNYELVWCSKLNPYSYFGEVAVEGSAASAKFTDHEAMLFTGSGSPTRIEPAATIYDGPWGVISHWLDAAAPEPWRRSPEGEAYKAYGSPHTFEQFEPVLSTIYRAVESAEKHIVMSFE